MEEIHGISEGSIVEVTETSGGPTVIDGLQVGADEILSQVTEGARFECRRVRQKVRTNKVMLTFFPAEGEDMPAGSQFIASTYPSSDEKDFTFDADGHITRYSDKYFNCEVVEE